MESTQERIDQILRKLEPTHLEIRDESALHRGHMAEPSHFNVVIVSEHFRGKSRVERQRLVYDLLKEEFKKGLHMLQLKTLTPEEFGKS